MYFILLYWKSATLIPCEKAISGVCDNREKFFFLLIGSILIVYSKIFNLWKVSFIYKTFSTNAKCYSCSFVPFYQEFCIKNCLSSTLLCLIVQGGSNKMHHRKNYHFVKWGAIFLKIFSRNLQFEPPPTPPHTHRHKKVPYLWKYGTYQFWNWFDRYFCLNMHKISITYNLKKRFLNTKFHQWYFIKEPKVLMNSCCLPIDVFAWPKEGVPLFCVITGGFFHNFI